MAIWLAGADLVGWQQSFLDRQRRAAPAACSIAIPSEEHAMWSRIFSYLRDPTRLARRAGVLVCLSMIVSSPREAAADSLRTTAGAGTSLCSAFSREYDQDPGTTAWIYLSWAQGYLSAVNLQRARLGQTAADMLPTDFGLPKQIGFLQAYCRSLPDRSFEQATIGMYHEMLERWPTAADTMSVP